MSGEFRPEQQTSIESTDDADLARRFGLTDFNRETGLWTAPKTPDAGQRDGADVHERQRAAAAAEGEQQDAKERELDEKAANLTGAQQGKGGPGHDVTESDERKPGAPTKATKAAAAKASQSKADDKTDDGKSSGDDDKK